MLDFHNHLIPGVDDGAANIDETRAGLRAMTADGITGIITTPHLAASLIDRGALDRYLEKIEVGWKQFESLVAAEFPRLKIARGFEVMLDVPHPDLSNALVRLAGTSFVLLEFPFMNVPPNTTYALDEIRAAGRIPVLAHPERYVNIEGQLRLIDEWREVGTYMQINAGSIVGQYGARAKKIAWSMLESGQADYMCSDYHSRGKCSVAAALKELRAAGMHMQVDALVMNAKRIIRGERPMMVERFTAKPRASWKKVFPWA
ncbi:MAG TPA: CpsB/CapC family capsule biosynthesis tyrosine phosphatase [Gemmatimonadaceae bacterium]|nr:CpsB/CapC family capsule biosynthesis tyrosine phosphatase [Gemmatimonadaceae bacterium]